MVRGLNFGRTVGLERPHFVINVLIFSFISDQKIYKGQILGGWEVYTRGELVVLLAVSVV